MLTSPDTHQPHRAKRRGRALLRQLAPLVVGAIILVAATLVTNVVQGRGVPAPPTVASVATLEGTAAPDFRLTDQFGAPLSLSALRGRVVVLTFLYSHCPDICSVTLGKFGIVHRMLGSAADDVAFLAITVDPARDDPAQLRRYLDAQGLAEQTRFLTGDAATLAPIWALYQITVVQGPAASATAYPEGYEVLHSDRIYLIDRDGCLRSLLRSTVTPQELLVSLSGLVQARRSAVGEVKPCG
jgi:protein SCO1/2